MTLTLKTSKRPTAPVPRAPGDNFHVPSARGLLSAEEIEALLRPDIPDDAFEEPEPETVTPHAMPELQDVPAEEGLQDDAGLLASRLTLALREACRIDAIAKVKHAEKAPLSYLISRHEGEPVLVLFCDADGVQIAGLTLDARLAAMIIDHSFGGGKSSTGRQTGRVFSVLDKAILKELFTPLAKMLDPEFTIGCIETNRSAAHALLPPGKAVLAELSCEVSGIEGYAAFARLLTASEPLSKVQAERRAGQLEVQLTARLASLSVPMSRLTDLKPGAVLLLGLPTDQPAELLSGGHRGTVVADGKVGRKGNNIAIQVMKSIKAFDR